MANAKSFKSVVKTLSNPVYSMVSDEEISNANGYKQRLNEYFINRSNARKSIDNGTLTSGNEAQDTFQTRVGKLVDPYLSLASEEIDEKGQPVFTEEKIKAASKDLSGTLSKMKEYYGKDKSWAIDDYVEKGGYATRVLDYLEGKSTSPYKYQEPEKVKEGFENFMSAFGSTPAQQLGGTMKIIDNKLGISKAGDEYQSKVNDLLRKNATTEDYERYKKEGYKPIEYTGDSYGFMDGIKAILKGDMSGKAREDASRSRKMLYDSYDKAVNNGFNGSVEDYVNYTIDVGEKTAETLADSIINNAKANYTEGTTSAELGNLAAIGTEIATTLPAVLGSVGLVGGVANGTPAYWKLVGDIAAGGLEFQALEDAYNAELSSISDYEESMLWNAVGNAFFKTMGVMGKKLLTKLGGIGSKAEEAIVEAGADEYSKAVNTIKNSGNNAADTVQKEIGKIIDDADKTMEKDWISKGAEKERVEKFEVKSKETPQKLLDNINSELETLGDKKSSGAKTREGNTPKLVMGETEEEGILRRKSERLAAKKAAEESAEEAQEKAIKAQEEEKRLAEMTPEERADEMRLKEINEEKAKKAAELEERKRKYELRIENESTYKKTTDDDAIDVMDVLKREWNKMFVEEGAEFNAVNLNDLMKTIRASLKGTEYGNDNAIQKIISGLAKTADELNLGSSYNKASKEHLQARDLIMKLRDIFGKSKNVQSDASKQIELAGVGGKAIQKADAAEVSELFTQIKNLYGIDLNNKIGMWIAALSLYDREAAEKMLKEIYPSVPGLTEFMIKSTMNLVGRGGGRILSNTKNINNVWDKIGGTVNTVAGAGAMGVGDKVEY